MNYLKPKIFVWPLLPSSEARGVRNQVSGNLAWQIEQQRFALWVLDCFQQVHEALRRRVSGHSEGSKVNLSLLAYGSVNSNKVYPKCFELQISRD